MSRIRCPGVRSRSLAAAFVHRARAGRLHRWLATPALVLVALLPTPLWAGALRGATVHICDDAAEWPPYTFYKRVDGQPTGAVIGFSVDVVTAILQKAGVESRIQLLPWARCQNELLAGTAYQLALNASYNETRAKAYHLSRPYYRTTNYYFYSKKVHPSGLRIEQLPDLRNHQVCGLFGYNYETYGLPAGSIDQGAYDFATIVAKLHAGRCDLFLEKYEVMAGFTAIGQPFLADPHLGRDAVPGMAPTEFYMMISRQAPHAEDLLKTINDGLAELEASGQLGRLAKKYLLP